MPLYDFACYACHRGWEGLAKWDETVYCSHCGFKAERLISPPTIQPEFIPYYDDGLGQHIESRDQRKRVMKAKNLVECDKGNTPAYGARGTIFSFPGRATESVRPSGVFTPKR